MTATHPERAAILADICANRRDLTPRLVYADWLEDHADTLPGREEDWRARAEFVRLGCRLARCGLRSLECLPPDARPDPAAHGSSELALLLQAESLLARHRHAWLDDEFRRADVEGRLNCDGLSYADDRAEIHVPLPARAARSPHNTQRVFPLRWKWRAGFLDHLTLPWPLWDAVGDRVHASWPVTEVEITGQSPTVFTERPKPAGPYYSQIGKRQKVVICDGAVPTLATVDQRLNECLAAYWPGVRFAFSRDGRQVVLSVT